MKTDIEFPLAAAQDTPDIDVDTSTLTAGPISLEPAQVTHGAYRPACLRGIDEYLDRLAVETTFDLGGTNVDDRQDG